LELSVGEQDLVEDALVDQVRAAGLIETERVQVLYFRSLNSKKRFTGDSEALLEVSAGGEVIDDNSLLQVGNRLLSLNSFQSTGMQKSTAPLWW
jgi:hypothetical protein